MSEQWNKNIEKGLDEKHETLKKLYRSKYPNRKVIKEVKKEIEKLESNYII